MPTAPLTRQDLEDLATAKASNGLPCLSVYLPTIRGGDTLQNPIRLKNQLHTATAELAEWGLRRPVVEDFLAPVRALLSDHDFLHAPSDGLALFRGKELFRSWRLPLALNELALVEDRFHLKPLFQLLVEGGGFYILTLSLKQVRLLRADRWSAEEIDLGDLPRVFREAMARLGDRFSQIRSGTASHLKGLSRQPIVHGHQAREDHLKAEIRQYFLRIDDGLAKVHLERSAPVVLAGVEYLLAMYHETSGYPHLLAEGLTGNADHLKPEELHRAAWEIVEPVLGVDLREAAARFEERIGTGLASSQVEEVVPAAHDGRVEALFAARGMRLWGRYDPGAREVVIDGHHAPLHGGAERPRPQRGSQDLADLAAVQTFLHKGTVYVLDADRMPGRQALAAVFRY
jgi:hypothetical protein